MDIAPLNEKTGYVRWMKSQGLPIHAGHGMADLAHWKSRPTAALWQSAFIHSTACKASPRISAKSRRRCASRSGICMKR
jgi:hypothetical protein